MFEKINLESELIKQRETDRRTPDEKILSEYKSLLEADWEHDERLRSALSTNHSTVELPSPERLDPDRIYDLKSIRKICLKYRLRFLGTELFQGEIPPKALTEIKQTESRLGTALQSFMIMAPAKMFRLEDANRDPLLFAPLNDGRFYLLARWGNDLSWSRALRAWPVKSPVHLVTSIFILAVGIALFLPNAWLTDHPVGYLNFYRLLAFVLNFIILCGLASYFWFMLGGKFTWSAWNCRTFN